jgi:CubicO group peptidase (beta-lactamase class C family)
MEIDPVLMQYQTARGVKPSFGGSRSLVESYDYPLLFESGDSWEYSVGADWAGEMVMRVTNMSLEDYMAKNIWAPLGMKHITFFPKKRPDVMERLADMSQRDCGITMFGTAEDPNAKLVYTDNTIWDMDTTECHGGAGGYGSVLDYHKMLHSICSDDGKLLKPSTVDEMFKPQLTDAAQAKLQELIQTPEVNQMWGGLPKDVRWNWGIGGIMNLDAYPGRSAGSIAWGGYPNLLWYCDRRAMSGIMGTQINPPGDVKVSELITEWVKATYEMAGVKEKEKM